MNHEWRGRADFAEVAEAVGVRTTSIMAAMRDGEEWTVLFTDDEDTDNVQDDTPLWTAKLSRGKDGVLLTDAQYVMGTWGQMRKQIEALVDKGNRQ